MTTYTHTHTQYDGWLMTITFMCIWHILLHPLTPRAFHAFLFSFSLSLCLSSFTPYNPHVQGEYGWRTYIRFASQKHASSQFTIAPIKNVAIHKIHFTYNEYTHFHCQSKQRNVISIPLSFKFMLSKSFMNNDYHTQTILIITEICHTFCTTSWQNSHFRMGWM